MRELGAYAGSHLVAHEAYSFNNCHFVRFISVNSELGHNDCKRFLGRRFYISQSHEVIAAPKVLVVDDDDLIRWSLVRFLSHAGYEVTTAVNGLEALTIAGTLHFDFVITDLCMPELDGWKLLDKLMQLQPPPRVIVMSAHEERDDHRMVKEKGGWAYLEKSGLLDRIIEALVNGSSK